MPPILKADSDSAILKTFAVMQELRPHLQEATYIATIQRLREQDRYELAYIMDEDAVKRVAGYRLTESLHAGRFLYVDDLITTADARSKHYGKAMLDWLEHEARALGCKEIHLDSGVQRHGAHRFYLRARLDIVSYHFRKAIL